jgi:hypothetical protein
MKALDKVIAIDGVTTIDVNERAFELVDDFAKNIEEPPQNEIEPLMTEIKEAVGANGVTASGYDGTGVVVGHIDTGADFGNPALQHAYHTDTLDSSGDGVVLTNVLVNSSAVENATKWFEDGNLLSYEMGGKYYINMSLDQDIYVNYHATGPHAYSMFYYVYVYAGAWGISNVTDFFEEYLWEDIEIPAPGNLTGNYHFGFLMQQRGYPSRAQPYAKLFSPTLVWNSTEDDKWKMAIDWDAAQAWQTFWTGGYYYEALDFNDTDDRQLVIDMIDSSFNDDIFTDGEIYDLDNPIVAYDYTGDGVDDFSFGALSWGFDQGGHFDDNETLFHGFKSDGNATCIYYDYQTHGTATALHVAAKYPDADWYYPEANDTFMLGGIAPEAKIISTKIFHGSDMGAWLWPCGFDYNLTSKEFYYSGNHQADLTTNSWGFVASPSSEFNYLTMTWTILSVPEYLDPSYPGVLHVCSAGNEGNGFMNVGSPSVAAGVLTVGASTTNTWLEYLYGPDVDAHYGIAAFSSRGPGYSGYPKPDVVAPGAYALSSLPWYAPYFQQYWSAGPYWGWGYYANTTVFGGTSQASPVTAGVCALVIEALGDNDPATIKTIIQSTATDMGYDPATQGFGLVDADAACDMAENDAGLHVYNEDSFNNLAALLDNPWHLHGVGLIETEVDNENTTHPRDMGDGGLFFGQVMPDDTVTIHQSVYTGGTMVDDTSGWTAASAFEWVAAETYTWTGTTFSYNDTVMEDEQMYGWFNLREELGAATYDTDMGAYTYVTVGVAFNESVIGNEPWMFLHDWTDDDPNDGMPNLWNETAGEGDELSRLTWASASSTVNIMPYATTTDLATALDGNMTLVIHDPIHDGTTWWNTTGNDFTCTVIFWEMMDTSSMFGFVDDASDTYTYNITLTVPSDADTGIHQGYVNINDGAVLVPYSFQVVANITTDMEEVTTIVDGWGEYLSPYDNAMWGIQGSDPDEWDFRSYVIYNKHATAKYLGVRVIWEDDGNNMFVSVADANATELASNGGETDTTTAVIATLPSNPVGKYNLFMHATALNGTVMLPVNYTIEVIWYDALTTKDVILSYTALDVPVPVPLAENDTATGDHCIMNASYPAFELTNMPEYEITDITMSFLAGIYEIRTGDNVDPGSWDDWPIPLSQTQHFVWEGFKGVPAGANVMVYLDIPHNDPSFDVYQWVDANGDDVVTNDEITGGSLLSVDDGGSDYPESGSFTAASDMDIAVRVFNWAWAYEPAEYYLEVDARIGIDAHAAGGEVTYDTYQFGANGTYQVKIVALTETNLEYKVELKALSFNNFFVPMVENVTVSGPGVVKTIEWDKYDINSGDDLYSEVYYSNDEGTTYQLIAANITGTSYEWDSSGFLETDYIVKVRVIDNDPTENAVAGPGDYWPGLFSEAISDSFTAGDYTTPTTTTPEETTTTTPEETTPTPTTIDPLLIGLIGGIGAGIVVVLILFLVKRK